MKKLHYILFTAAIFTAAICSAQNTDADLIAPQAQNITMTPIVQASSILPFVATAVNNNIAAYIFETVPAASQGVVNIDMNGEPMAVTEGMMLTPDMINSLSFAPVSTFTGNVVFTYSATDENSLSSNIATYTIPVVGEQPVILPIRLLQFTGTASNKKAQLNWQTTQENNSSYFELQRSTDGNNFETIATATAKGSTINDYEHTDDLFFYTYQTVYYRVKMVAVDGSFQFSQVVILQLNTTTKNNVKAWPLPFTSNLNVSYNSELNEAVKISIHSINGAAVITTGIIVKKGNNLINLHQAQSIPAGTYLLTISSSTKAETIKVIKN